MSIPTEHVDAVQLENDLQFRVAYLVKFIGFTAEDAEALHVAAPFAKGLIPTIVDLVYERLFSFDITKKVFLPRNTGFEGKVASGLDELTVDNDQIKFRKDFLKNWAAKVFTSNYTDPKTFEYFDKVGLMHTGVAGFKHREKKSPLFVDYMHCSILLGYVEDILLQHLLAEPSLTLETKTAVVRALNKVLWIQNDLFARHYIGLKSGDADTE